MIKLILGGIGSGKTLSAIHFVMERKNPVYSNLDITHPNNRRLKVSDICIPDETDPKGRRLKPNWDFWENVRSEGMFDVVIDEAHNIINSHRGGSHFNVCFIAWISQIRKALSGNAKNHLILVTQRLYSIDNRARELAWHVIQCTRLPPENPHKPKEKFIIIKKHFVGEHALFKYDAYAMDKANPDYVTALRPESTFKWFDTLKFVRFGDSDYL